MLLAATPEAWYALAERSLDVLLVDHANCEKKAASTALGLMFAYADDSALGLSLARLAREDVRVARLIFVNEHFQNGGIRQELRHHDALARFVGALLINRFFAGHSESDHNGTAVAFDHVLRGDGQVLESGHRGGYHVKGIPVTGAVCKFGTGRSAHVVTRKHRVNDADANWLWRLLLFTHVQILGAFLYATLRKVAVAV